MLLGCGMWQQALARCEIVLSNFYDAILFRRQGSRLMLMLHGNPSDTKGIYREGTELWVTPLQQLTHALEA